MIVDFTAKGWWATVARRRLFTAAFLLLLSWCSAVCCSYARPP